MKFVVEFKQYVNILHLVNLSALEPLWQKKIATKARRLQETPRILIANLRIVTLNRSFTYSELPGASIP